MLGRLCFPVLSFREGTSGPRGASHRVQEGVPPPPPVQWAPGASSLPVFSIVYGTGGGHGALVPPVPPPALSGFVFMWVTCSYAPLTKGKG